MKIRFLPSAIDDLRTGFHFYQGQGEDLGHYFLESLFSDIDSLILYAGVHRVVLGHYRMTSKRFPYAVYYILDDDVVVVHRVLDERLDPKRIRKLLE